MRITEAIIRVNGVTTSHGSSLQPSAVCMKVVNDRPFLSFIINALRMQGIERFIFSLSSDHAIVEDYLQNSYPTLDYIVAEEKSHETETVAIKNALQKATSENVLLQESGKFLTMDLKTLTQIHLQHQAICTITLASSIAKNYSAGFKLEGENRVLPADDNISTPSIEYGGSCIVNKRLFLEKIFPANFSFNDCLQTLATDRVLFGSVQPANLLDLNNTDVFDETVNFLKPPVLDLSKIDKTWTLFLDRDGVINLERLGLYVLNWGEFEFLDGVLESLQILSKTFGRVIIISNQRGVTKNLMTEDDLIDIHNKMINAVKENEGHIEKIYYCIEKDDKCFYRKPNPGMALLALNDFPDIDLSKSIMVGNKPSDMAFGRAAGMFTIFVTTTNPEQPFPHPDIDFRFDSLSAFTKALKS